MSLAFQVLLQRSAPRFLRRLLPVSMVLLAFVAAGCQGPGPNYLQQGIGAELPAADIVSASTAQRLYFDELCGQAGVGSPCLLPSIDANWTLIAYQGMNDIDRRCDAYLQWLDDKKRSRGPLLSQVNAVGATAQAIIGFVDPGAVRAINIVGQAFGLLSKSIENYHSRLLLEVESSTINSVVLRARHDFRKGIERSSFRSRPDVEYVLRSYLRLCLPFAIETNINDYSTLGSLRIEVSEENSINSIPAIGATLRRDTPDTVFVPLKPTRPAGSDGGGSSGPTTGKPFDTMSQGRIEQRYSKQGVRDLQSRLCVTQSGAFDDRTRAAIRIVEAGIGSNSANGEMDTGTEEDVILTEREGCTSLPTGAANTFEKFHFLGEENLSAQDEIRRFQGALLNCVTIVEQVNARPFEGKPPASAFSTGVFDAATRAAIRYLAADLVVADKDQALASGLLSAEVVRSTQNCVFTPRSG